MAGSVYIGFYFDQLVIKVGIFTFFLFIKKWIFIGFLLLVFLWIVENLHIIILKGRIREILDKDDKATDVQE